jgi:hypothetical protein
MGSPSLAAPGLITSTVEHAALQGWIADWATADSMSMRGLPRVLGRAVDRPAVGESNPEFAPLSKASLPAPHDEQLRVLERWAENQTNEWLPRLACVALLKWCRRGHLVQESIGICERAVRNPGRFAQLGVGWVLREIRTRDIGHLMSFLETHQHSLSREAMTRAVRNMPDRQDLRKQLLNSHHRATGTGRMLPP